MSLTKYQGAISKPGWHRKLTIILSLRKMGKLEIFFPIILSSKDMAWVEAWDAYNPDIELKISNTKSKIYKKRSVVIRCFQQEQTSSFFRFSIVVQAAAFKAQEAVALIGSCPFFLLSNSEICSLDFLTSPGRLTCFNEQVSSLYLPVLMNRNWLLLVRTMADSCKHLLTQHWNSCYQMQTFEACHVACTTCGVSPSS